MSDVNNTDTEASEAPTPADPQKEESDANALGTGASAAPPPADPRKEEKDALRAYLARCEVRLSTTHRIAGAFIGGAGLLTLLPLFLKDTIGQMVTIFGWVNLTKNVSDLTDKLRWMPTGSDEAARFLLMAPVLITLLIPLSALYLLVRELVLFYFSGNIPDCSLDDPEPAKGSQKVFNPRFTLTAIAFPNDEGSMEPTAGTKSKIRKIQFGMPLSDFVLPKRQKAKAWLQNLFIKSITRRVALTIESPYLPKPDPPRSAVPPDDIEDTDCLRMAFGLTGAYDDNLVAEAAKSELALVRNNLVLRRLVMRYIKALLLLIWTALILFALSPTLQTLSKAADPSCATSLNNGSANSPTPNTDAAGANGGQANIGTGGLDASLELTAKTNDHNEKSPVQIALASLCVWLLVWSGFASFLIRAPIRWIYKEVDQNQPGHIADPQIQSFERIVAWLCFIASVTGGLLAVSENSPWGFVAGIAALTLNSLVLLKIHKLVEWHWI